MRKEACHGKSPRRKEAGHGKSPRRKEACHGKSSRRKEAFSTWCQQQFMKTAAEKKVYGKSRAVRLERPGGAHCHLVRASQSRENHKKQYL